MHSYQMSKFIYLNLFSKHTEDKTDRTNCSKSVYYVYAEWNIVCVVSYIYTCVFVKLIANRVN